MIEPADAKELIDDAIERAESHRDVAETAERAAERTFRDRVSVLIGVFAVTLAIVHMAAAGAVRESLLHAVEASDTFAYMQAKIVRETVYKAAALSATLRPADRAAAIAEGKHLRAPDKAGHGIGQLQTRGEELRVEGARAVAAGEGYELGETALQMSIVLLSIALVARSRLIVYGAVALATAGALAALATAAGITLPSI